MSADRSTKGRRQSSAAASALAAFLFTSSAAHAQLLPSDPGDVKRGFDYTQRRCAECHAVDGRQRDRPPTPGIATFEEIANARGMTPRALVVWFQSPHPNMPNLILERADRDDVIAYIMSLKKGQ